MANRTLECLPLKIHQKMHQTAVPSPLDTFISVALIFILLHAVIANIGYWLLEKKRAPGNTKNNPISIPRVGKDPKEVGMAAARTDFLRNGYQLIREGYKKYKSSAFVVQTADMERVILSNRFVNELRSLPEEVLSLRKAMSERHFGGYTTLNIIQLSHLQNDVCRQQLQQNLGGLILVMYEEMKHALSHQLAQCDTQNWQTANVYKAVCGSVGQVTSRSFVGHPLCRDPKWLDTAIGYTGDVFAVSQDLRDKHWLARPFIYIFLNSRKRLQSRIQAGRNMLIPLLKERAEQLPEKPQSDLLQWMTERAQGADKTPYRLADKILFLCLASIHTSSSTAVHILYDLCQYAEDCVPVLREEITRTISEDGLTLASINKMKKLDSFIKESQRMNHPGTLAFNRKVVKPITLSNGIELAPGTFLSIPSAEISRDADNYANPEDFNPWRFEQKRNSSPSEANKHQFVSTSVESLPFGMGKFACPGRFFAAGMIKILLVILITEYEFQFPGGQKERPVNTYLDERIAPSTSQEMGFRRRT